MGLIVSGISTCDLCGKVIAVGQEVMAFPPFATNRKDPLAAFHDGGYHAACVKASPLGARATAVHEEIQKKSGRMCAVCNSEISNPVEYFGLGYLTDDPSSELRAHNFTHLHAACVASWTSGPKVRAALQELVASGAWEGPQLKKIINRLPA